LIGNFDESQDMQLACLLLFVFAADVQGHENAFRGKKWHQDPNLRVRIRLLIDNIHDQRNLFLASERGLEWD
jgi:hypothetical protein